MKLSKQFIFLFHATGLYDIVQVRTFRSIIPLSPDSSNVMRTNFLLFIAAGQFVIVFFLCYLDFNAFGLNVMSLFRTPTQLEMLDIDEPILAQ